MIKFLSINKNWYSTHSAYVHFFLLQIFKSPNGRFDPKTLCVPLHSGTVQSWLFFPVESFYSSCWWFVMPRFPCSGEAAVPEWGGVGALPLAALFGPGRARHLRPALPFLPDPLRRHGHPLPAQPAVLPLLRGLAESCCQQADKLNSGRTAWRVGRLLESTLSRLFLFVCVYQTFSLAAFSILSGGP